MLTHDKNRLASLAFDAGLAFVVLFGSQARGTERAGSDVDVAIMPIDGDTPDSSLDLFHDLGCALGRFDLDVIWLPTAGWLLWDQVARDGKVLLETTAGSFRSFQRMAARRHADCAVWRWRERAYLKRWLEGTLAMDTDLVRRKLETLTRVLGDMDRFLATEDTLGGLNHYIGERLLELLVEYAADINTEVAQGVAGIPPSNYYSSFFSLAQAGWISSDMAKALSRCVGFRNRLVHAYDEVSMASLIELLEKTRPIWRQYAAAILKHLEA